MTLRRDHEDALVFAEDARVIRRTLVACSKLLAWAEENAGPQFREAVAAASEAAGLSRSPSGLAYDISLSIDHLDFSPSAWRNR
jgi:hypothetical protein